MNYSDIIHYLDYHYLCNKCDTIVAMHERASWNYEYGISWYEFIETESLDDILKAWFESLDEEEVKEIIDHCKSQLEYKLNKISNWEQEHSSYFEDKRQREMDELDARDLY